MSEIKVEEFICEERREAACESGAKKIRVWRMSRTYGILAYKLVFFHQHEMVGNKRSFWVF